MRIGTGSWNARTLALEGAAQSIIVNAIRSIYVCTPFVERQLAGKPARAVWSCSRLWRSGA
ncbi:MAG TPA: hypothetical protein VFX76_05015 [Roseiflexaceae bacterium]|nr:hypothetical protein [Roseiflexaceae bacterium]